MFSLTAALIVLAAVPLAQASAAPDAADAQRVFVGWLEALRVGDVGRMTQHSRLPFFAAGFDVRLEKACDRPLVAGLTERPVVFSRSMLRMDAPDPVRLGRGLRCLLQDDLLRDYLPIAQEGRWPSGSDSKGNSGTVVPVTARTIARGLRRFARPVRELARSHLLLQATWTDNNGVTVTALGALANDDGGQVKLTAVLLHELFEE